MTDCTDFSKTIRQALRVYIKQIHKFSMVIAGFHYTFLMCMPSGEGCNSFSSCVRVKPSFLGSVT